MEDQLLGPPGEGSWLTLLAATQRLDVTAVTVRRWMEAGRLEGVKRSERWIGEESIQRLVEELREDAASWVSLAKAGDVIGCSIKTIPGLVAEGLVVQRPGSRQQASINRESAEQASRVLAERRVSLTLE